MWSQEVPVFLIRHKWYWLLEKPLESYYLYFNIPQTHHSFHISYTEALEHSNFYFQIKVHLQITGQLPTFQLSEISLLAIKVNFWGLTCFHGNFPLRKNEFENKNTNTYQYMFSGDGAYLTCQSVMLRSAYTLEGRGLCAPLQVALKSA